MLKNSKYFKFVGGTILKDSFDITLYVDYPDYPSNVTYIEPFYCQLSEDAQKLFSLVVQYFSRKHTPGSEIRIVCTNEKGFVILVNGFSIQFPFSFIKMIDGNKLKFLAICIPEHETLVNQRLMGSMRN